MKTSDQNQTTVDKILLKLTAIEHELKVQDKKRTEGEDNVLWRVKEEAFAIKEDLRENFKIEIQIATETLEERFNKLEKNLKHCISA